MAIDVVDHLWLAVRKSKHEMANGEWWLELDEKYYENKHNSLTESPSKELGVSLFC